MHLKNSKKIVIKIGSSLLIDKSKKIRLKWLTEFSKDIIGIEICSAIKNIYAMVIGSGQNLNSKSDLFQKSANEMKFLIKYFKGDVSTILGP